MLLETTLFEPQYQSSLNVNLNTNQKDKFNYKCILLKKS